MWQTGVLTKVTESRITHVDTVLSLLNIFVHSEAFELHSQGRLHLLTNIKDTEFTIININMKS